MIEVGIPVYKARDTLRDALDSLVCQTKKQFITCLSIDGDGEDYSDIISDYAARGLKIRVINSKENGGPGMARQRILDTTQCDYLMYLDADDMFTPRAVEVLFRHIKTGNFDIVKGGIIRENPNGPNDLIMDANSNVTTWFHAKMYKVAYLKEKGISFLPGLRYDEDAYFNVVACNSTEKRGVVNEFLYVWRFNRKSITREKAHREYFIDSHMSYIRGQVEGLKKIYEINNGINSVLVTHTLINIYYYYMEARFYRCDEEEMDKCISTLRDEDWMQKWLATGENWMDLISNIKPGQIFEKSYVVFFEETFNKWAVRLLKR